MIATNPARRRVLAALLGAYTATLVPWALAQPVRDDKHGAFLALSAIIAGRQTLDAGLATRLYQALTDLDPDFPQAAQALLKYIEDHKVDPSALQKALDDEHSPLAEVPRKVASAWFLGIVGSGESARCLAYEHALNAEIVSDVLKPPTYSYGAYGTWTRKPT
ncbi:MAG: sorbitol dehydrogenase family protein [Alcaligenaceae bacterium]|nr:sorbitol dehydrogenase family protein [Alcaligenaceae bacterium]